MSAESTDPAAGKSEADSKSGNSLGVPIAIPFPDCSQQNNLFTPTYSLGSLPSKTSDEDEPYLHGLTQEIAQSSLSASGSESQATSFSATLNSLIAAWPFALLPFDVAKAGFSRTEKIDRWERCGKLVPRVFQMKNEFHLLDDVDKYACASFSYFVILNEAAWYLFESANSRESIDLVDAALKSFGYATQDIRRVLGQSHSIRGNLATLLNDSERALYHANAAMAGQDQFFSETGKTSREYGIAALQLGEALMNSGLWTEADELFQKTIVLLQGEKRFNRHSLFEPLLGRACLLWMRQDYHGAAEALLEALRDRELAYGQDDKQGGRTGDLLYGLGKVRSSQGLLDQSFAYYFRAVAQYRSTIGDMHAATARAAYKLAEHYMRLRDLENASMLLELARNVYGGQLDHHGREYARTLYKIGQLLQLKGDGIAAQDSFSRAWEMRKQYVKNDKRDVSELQEADYDSKIEHWTR